MTNLEVMLSLKFLSFPYYEILNEYYFSRLQKCPNTKNWRYYETHNCSLGEERERADEERAKPSIIIYYLFFVWLVITFPPKIRFRVINHVKQFLVIYVQDENLQQN